MNVRIEPRKTTDRGGYVCMPLVENCPTGHKDWKKTNCPNCGTECWMMPGMLKLKEEQGATPLCTMCALREGVQTL